MTGFTCPCCGYLVFSSPPGTYEICPICGWEDDISQLRFVSMDGGANELSLIDAQRNFLKRSLKDELVFQGYIKDSDWRLLDVGRDDIEVVESGKDYGLSYPKDSVDLYYWRAKK